MRYFRRDGTPYEGNVVVWARDFESTDRSVAVTKLKNGGKVSTVFLGLNHQFGDGPPLIFESMYCDADGESWDCARYSTEQQAIEGRAAMVTNYGGGGVSRPKIDIADIEDRMDGTGTVRVTDAECEVLVSIARDYLYMWLDGGDTDSLVIGEYEIADSKAKPCR